MPKASRNAGLFQGTDANVQLLLYIEEAGGEVLQSQSIRREQDGQVTQPVLTPSERHCTRASRQVHSQVFDGFQD